MKVFSCPECGASLRAEQFSGLTVKCPYCDSSVIVPEELRPRSSVIDESNQTALNQPAIDPATRVRTIIFVALISLAVLLPIIIPHWIHTSSIPDIRMNTPRDAQASATPNVLVHPPVAKANLVTPGVALTFGKSGTSSGSFQRAHGITLDESGNIYVSDETERIQKFSPAGKFLSLWTTPREVQSGDTQSGPHKLFTDQMGRICVVTDGQLIKYDVANGNRLIIRDDYIEDAALMKDNGSLLITYKSGKSYLAYLDANGNELKRRSGFLSDGLPNRVTLLTSALRLALDQQENIFVLYALGTYNGAEHFDTNPIAVYKLAPDGRYVSKFGLEGRGPDQLEMPTAIAIDHQNHVYVSEQTGDIKVFDTDGNYLMTLKTPHSAQALAFGKDNNFYIAGASKVSKLVLSK